MRKIFILTMSLMLTSCWFSNGKEEFVNPIFYEKMEPAGSSIWSVKILPTLYYSENKYGFGYYEQCKMLENTWDKVVLKCTLSYDQPALKATSEWHKRRIETRTYVFQILSPEEQISKDVLYIDVYSYYEDDYNKEKRYPSIIGYIVPTPKE